MVTAMVDPSTACTRSRGDSIVADDFAVAGVNGRVLARGHIFGLGFDDFDLRLETCGVGHSGHQGTGDEEDE